MLKLITFVCLLPVLTVALDNGLRVPPMGWSSWYGFTSNIDEGMLRDMGDGMISSGLQKAGYKHIWIDDGWVLGRENKSGTCGALGPTGADSCKPIVDDKLFPSGMRNLSDYLHDKGLKFGIYTSKGPKTCLGYQPPPAPFRVGSCGYEQVDADTYVHDWQVDQVKDDGCGPCPQHEPFAAMRDALNKTGKPIWYAIHSSIIGVGNPNATVANMWRTGGDLSAGSYDMWTNRLDLATTDVQAALTGPGAFPNPDFLEVGYSPRMPKGRMQSVLSQRSMFTMWAALPGPLILSADLRPGAKCGGIDAEVLEILTNKEVIDINQDPRAAPMRPVYKRDGVQVWRKPLQNPDVEAVILFNRNYSQSHLQSNSTASPPTSTATMATASSTAGNHYRYDAGAAPKAGDMVTVGVSDARSSAFDFKNNAMVLRSNPALCVGSVGAATCANPQSPKLGLVKCAPSDATQHWCPPDKDGVLRQSNSCSGESSGESSGASAMCLNLGPLCKPDSVISLLIYPFQLPVSAHQNEVWVYTASTGRITTVSGKAGIVVAAPAPPPPPPFANRTIIVTWEELGYTKDEVVLVRDLWRKTEANATNSFSATVAPQEASIYTFTRQ